MRNRVLERDMKREAREMEGCCGPAHMRNEKEENVMETPST